MGMCAEILAIGKFKGDIVSYLEYPAEFYSNTKAGAPVVRILFGIHEGSSLSREFACLLGITDPWDFSQHKLDPENVNKEGLAEFVKMYDSYKKDFEAFSALIEAKFDFFFMPNG